MTRKIMVTSGKGGVGKTTITANLGLAMAKLGKKVCLIDMDLGLKNLDIAMGLENRLIFDAKDIMAGKCSVEEALVKDKRSSSLYLLSVCKTINLEKIQFEKLKSIIDEIENQFDILLFDCPAGIEKGFTYSMLLSDEALCVVQLDIASLMDADRVIGILLRNHLHQIRVVINRIDPISIQKKVQCTLNEALDYLSLDCAGVLYEDMSIQMGNNLGNGKMSNLSQECFNVLARRVLGQKIDLPKYRRKSFLQKWIRQEL